MDKKITKIVQAKAFLPKRKRVCAYTRVSSGKDAMLHSLSAQVSYYSDLIRKNPEWEYAGVYTDEALTGTRDTRREFQRMLTDCRNSKIDMIVTKSISRFARNTVTLLETARELKTLGVDVYFEEQNIHTMSGDGELMLTILASYAQEESRSVSENCKWRIREKFRKGIPCATRMNGYHVRKGRISIIPEEADTIRLIYDHYLKGMGINAITRMLNENGIPAKFGGTWHDSVVERIIQNEKYQGDLLLQKQFRTDHLEKRDRKNRGEMPQYLVENNHEAIVSRDTYDAVQRERQRRAALYPGSADKRTTSVFTGKLICAKCGKHYKRRMNHGIPCWQCKTYMTRGKQHCNAKQLQEEVLKNACCAALGMEQFSDAIFREKTDHVIIADGNQLLFHCKDANVIKYIWKDPTRSNSWNEQMKQAAAERSRRRWRHE